MSVDVQEVGGIEVVGWSSDASTFLYRTRVQTDHEGATVGVMLTPAGDRREVLLSLATDPGAVPTLGDELAARGVLPDAAPFLVASERAVVRHAPTSFTSSPNIHGTYGQPPWTRLSVSVHDCPADRVVVAATWDSDEGPQRISGYSAPDGRGVAVVMSWGAPGMGPGRLVLDRARRTVEIVSKQVPEERVQAVATALGAQWDVVATGPAKSARARTAVYSPDTLSADAERALMDLLALPEGSAPELLPLTWAGRGCVVVALGKDIVQP